MPQLDELSGAEQEALLGRLMKKQARLSIGVACGFISLLIAIPLINTFAPTLAAKSVGGFTLSWLVLGVLFYPLTWLLSGYFVRRSDRIEEEMVREESL